MTDELLKLLLGTGVGGIIGGIALWQLQAMRREHRDDMAALHDALENLPAWLQAIHSRLSSLKAESMPPPVIEPRRRKNLPVKLPRLQTAPAGYPAVPEPVKDQEDP